MMPSRSLVIVTMFASAVGREAPPSDDSAFGADAAGGGTPECFSSSECPVGWVCSEFGTCVPPPPPPPDGGPPPPPPEVEYELTEPIASLRFVWVAMTDQDRLAKIDGTNL